MYLSSFRRNIATAASRFLISALFTGFQSRRYTSSASSLAIFSISGFFFTRPCRPATRASEAMSGQSARNSDSQFQARPGRSRASVVISLSRASRA